jgi:hypothetical protein
MRGPFTTFLAGVAASVGYPLGAMRLVGLLGWFVFLAAACGGQVGQSPADGSGGLAGSGATETGGAGTTGGYGARDAGPDAPHDAGLDVVEDVRSDYVEPTCPDAAPLPVDQQCDLSNPSTSCPAGSACYPSVTYPDPTVPCAQEQYGTTCASSGSGVQGDPCDYNNSCSAGYTCVLTGEGTQCVQLCQVFGSNTCPPGFFCLQIDVSPGTGGCY